MKNQFILALGFMTLLAFNGKAQLFKASVALQDDPKKAITHVAADKLSSDDYDISIFLAGTQEVVDKIETYRIETTVSINGERAKSDAIYFSFQKSSDGDKDEFLVTPSLKVNFSMEAMIEANADLVQEKGNKLKMEFLHTDDQQILSTCEFTFDVAGFNTFDSDFCDLLEARNTDKKVEATLHAMFKMMYPHDEIVETLCDGEWGEFTDYKGNLQGASLTYMLIFKYKGKLWKLRYFASYVVEDGVLLDKPRVKIYNGMDDPEPVNPSCLKALQATLN